MNDLWIADALHGLHDDHPRRRLYVEGLGMAVMYTGPDIGGVPMITHLLGAR